MQGQPVEDCKQRRDSVIEPLTLVSPHCDGTVEVWEVKEFELEKVLVHSLSRRVPP